MHIAYRQSHYIEVTQGAIFMEQNMRFGLILGRLAMLKKKSWGADYEQLLMAISSCFQGQNKIYIYFKYRSVCTKKLHNIYYFDFFWQKDKLNIHNQLCSALLKTPLCTNFI